jgi:tRNA(fMet)-specific endonuclease VapC
LFCFDTDVLSVFLRDGANPPTQRRLATLSPDDQFTTSITVGELEYGAERRRSARLRRQIDELVRSGITILSFDLPAARAYAPLRARLEREGSRLDEPDLRIAAICIARDLTLVTGNVRHFERVPGLRVENWLE